VALIFLREQLVDGFDRLGVFLLVGDDADALEERDAARMILELCGARPLSEQAAPAALQARDGLLATVVAILAQGLDVGAR
jgi:hypothetical protein